MTRMFCRTRTWQDPEKLCTLFSTVLTTGINYRTGMKKKLGFVNKSWPGSVGQSSSLFLMTDFFPF
jgi:hypothetical protein